MRLRYLGSTPIVFVHDGLPEWQPGAVLDVADALAAKLLAENPNTLAEVKPEPEAEAKAEPVVAKGKTRDSAGADGEKVEG